MYARPVVYAPVACGGHAACACHSMQDKDSLARIILENGVNHVVHLATLLSGAPTLCEQAVTNRHAFCV